MSDSPEHIPETKTPNLPDLPNLPVAPNLPDLPVAPVTKPEATENAAAADPPPAPGEAPVPWQHGVHSTEREAVVDGIMAAFKKLQNPALPGESDLRPAAEKFEATCFEKADSKNAYLDKIKRRMERMATNAAKERTAKETSAPAPHPVKSSAREVDWKCDAKGVVLNDKAPFLHPNQLESYKSLPSFKGNSIWAGSMLCNPARASLRAGRPITAAEKEAVITPLSLVALTKHASPRPVFLAMMVPEGNPAKTTLIAMLYNDTEQPAKPICYDYEGADATERAIATLGSIDLGSKTIKHICRLHPHVGAMAWSARKHFNKFDLAGKPPEPLGSIRRFMVVVMPRANKGVETDFAELCSKNADSDTNALSNKLTTRVEASPYFSLDRPGATEQLTILKDRCFWYTSLSAFVRKHAHGRIMNENVGGAIAVALEKARAVKPVRPSTADDSDEEMVVAPKPKAGPHRRVAAGTKRSAPDDEDDAADDDSEVEAEDRTVPVKKRSIKKSKHTATHIPDSDAEEKNEESDDESELGDDDDDDDDDENDDEDDEDMAEVSADEAAPGPELTEPEKLKKKVNKSKQPVLPPKPPASSTSKAEGKKPMLPVDKAKEAHIRRAKEAIEVGKKMEASGYGAVKRAVCNAGYSTLMEDVNEWWRASGREVPVDKPAAPKAKPTAQAPLRIEQVPEQPEATDRRRLAVAVRETVSDFHLYTGLEGDDLHPALLQCTGQVYRVKAYAKLLETEMTATVLDDSKESYTKAITAFNNYHRQLVRLLSGVMAQYNSSSSSSSTTDTPTEGVHRAVSATANNLLKTTPQIAELGAQLAKVSGEFNSLVAKLNSNALSIAEGMEAAVAAQK